MAVLHRPGQGVLSHIVRIYRVADHPQAEREHRVEVRADEHRERLTVAPLERDARVERNVAAHTCSLREGAAARYRGVTFVTAAGWKAYLRA